MKSNCFVLGIDLFGDEILQTLFPWGFTVKNHWKGSLCQTTRIQSKVSGCHPRFFFDGWLKWKEPTPFKVHRTDHLMKGCHGGWPLVDEGMKPVTWDETSLITLLFGPASQLTYFWCHFWNHPQTRSRLKELFSLLNQKKVRPVAIKSSIHGTGTFALNLR